MTLSYKEYLFIAILVAFLVMTVFWGFQKHRADSLTAERALNQNIQTQEKVKREYIPMKLEEKRSDELTRIGANLWGE
jgi:cell division protein FtsL